MFYWFSNLIKKVFRINNFRRMVLVAVSKFCFLNEYSSHFELIQCLSMDKISFCKKEAAVYGITVYRKSGLFNTCRNMG